MTQVYLDWAADVIRAAGVTVVEVDRCEGGRIIEGPGWKRRGRSGGKGYEPGRPWVCMWHHTAAACSGSPNGQVCDAITRPDSAPIANVFLWCDGICYLLAGGPTNTNGKGWQMKFSRGTVPADSMNSYAFGMEIVNNGVGGAYPQVQIDAAFAISNAINLRVGNLPTDIAGHVHYTNRKIDPATAAAVEGPWRPRSINSSGSWNLDDMRAECTRRASGPAPTPEPEPEPEDDMANRALIISSGGGQFPGSTAVVDYTLSRKTFVSGDDAQALNKTGQYDWITISGEVFDSIPGTTPVDVVGDGKGNV